MRAGLYVHYNYVKLQSRITIPRSLMEVTGTIVLFKKFKDMSSDSEFNNCRVPTNKNFVFLGLINSEFLQHHSATRRRSVSSLCLASDTSLIENDIDILDSSTNEFKSHGRLYICKKAMGKNSPLGRTADEDEPMRTF